MELAVDLMRASECLQARAVGTAPFRRPFLPRRRRQLRAQDFKTSKAQQHRALRTAKRFEIGAARRARPFSKPLMRQMQSRKLGARHASVCHKIGIAQRGDLRLQSRRRAGKFVDGFHIDIERIEKQPAVGRIGAGVLGALGKQRVQRIETDGGDAARRGDLNQMLEIGEIAVPPVAARAQRIELHGQRPQPPSVALEGALHGAVLRRHRLRAARCNCVDQPRQSLGAGGVMTAQTVIIFRFDAPSPRRCRQIVHARVLFPGTGAEPVQRPVNHEELWAFLIVLLGLQLCLFSWG
jgi:hypothetical protein